MRLNRPCSFVLLLCSFLGLGLGLLPGGCSYTFDSGPLDVPVIGEPLRLSQLPSIPGMRLAVPPQSFLEVPATLVPGADGVPWIVSLQRNLLRAASLDRPEEVIEMEDGELQVLGPARYLFLHRPGAGSAGRLTLLTLGRPPRALSLPPEDDRAQMVVGGVLSWQAANPAAGLHVVLWGRDDSAVVRTLDWPVGITPLENGWISVLRDPEPYALLITAKDERVLHCMLSDGKNIDLGWVSVLGYLNRNLLYTDLRGQLFVYFVPQRVERPLGKELPMAGLRLAYADPTGRGLALCSSAGLLAVDIEAGVPSASLRTLDPAPCGWMDFASGQLVRYQRAVTQLGQDIRLYLVPFDGSEPPREVPLPAAPPGLPAGAAELSECNDLAAYSLGQVEPGASSDIWVGGRRISERGQYPRFSRDCRRIRWFEHNESAPGELLSVRSDEEERTLRLGRNVLLWRELPDGRVLVATSVFPSSETRLIVVDEERAQAVLLLRTESPINEALTAWDQKAGPWDHRVVLDVSSPNGEPSLSVLAVPPR